MNEIIKKAVEGGYEGLTLKDIETHNYDEFSYLEMTQDPLFWSCLGKSLGWEDSKCSGKCGSVYPEYVNGCVRCGKGVDLDPNMLYHALRYFELVLTQGDTEQFWSDLIKK